MSQQDAPRRVALDVSVPIWERFFLPAPLLVVGTKEPDGAFDLAPKHMAAPLSWEDHWGFVCTPTHATYRNVRREGVFTVSFPRPEQVLLASLAAAPRSDTHEKPALAALPTMPASKVEGVLLRDAYLWFECELDRVVDGFGRNSLIAGRIVAATVAEDALRDPEVDDAELLNRAPLLVYLQTGRWARVSETQAFPFHVGWSR